LNNILKKLGKLLVFDEPKKTDPFILKENKGETQKNEKEYVQKSSKDIRKDDQPEENKNSGLVKPKMIQTEANKEKAEKERPEKEKVQDTKTQEKEIEKDKSEEKSKDGDISNRLSDNLGYVKKKFTIPENGDVVLREFDITVRDKTIPAFIVFYDGMVDRQVINNYILQPLMILSNLDIKGKELSVAEFIKKHILPHNQLKETGLHQEVIDEVNYGGCGLYIDGINIAFAADVKGWQQRGVERPNTELVIRGPQEGFNESLRGNTSLIRKRLKDENLIVESVSVGKISKTPCSMLYIKDVANDSLVEEVRKRLENIEIDYILDTGELEQFIEDNPYLPTPEVIATERPDRVCSMLIEGRVAIIMSGSPFALAMPITNSDLIHTAEDEYLRFPYANLLRIIRIGAAIMSLLLPGIYIAITNFHQEMIPTDLLLAIASARERVPFPSIVEVLIMEVSFELIREAGIRIPGPIGSTLGIIGALILGQAAVAANIVSPILIIIVAVTGIGSFAIPNFSTGFAFRIMRFGYIILAAISGFLGITAGLFLLGLWFCSAKSFGVPYLAPFAPHTAGRHMGVLFKTPVWKQEKRPDYLNAKDKIKQAKISREWTKK